MIQETPVPKPQESSMPESEVISNSSSVGWGTSEGDDFDYIPVTPWAPIALGLGLIGLTGFIGPFGLYVAFFGLFVSIAAVAKVRAGAGTVKGGGMAWAGLVLSAASLTLGSAKMYHNYQTEVPEGFARVNFPKDVAEKQFVFIGGKRKLHPDVASLMGTKVYLKGYMWATQDTEGLTSFILLKDNGECCFGGRPKSHDYIWVKLPTFKHGERPQLSRRASSMTVLELSAEEKAKLGVDHEEQLATCAFIGKVAVAGVLKADVTAGEKGPAEDFDFAPVYSMDAELVEEAWTPF